MRLRDIPEGDCDCDGNVLDECGVCAATASLPEIAIAMATSLTHSASAVGCEADADSDGICDDVCVGELDACGVCNGPGDQVRLFRHP